MASPRPLHRYDPRGYRTDTAESQSRKVLEKSSSFNWTPALALVLTGAVVLMSVDERLDEKRRVRECKESDYRHRKRERELLNRRRGRAQDAVQDRTHDVNHDYEHAKHPECYDHHEPRQHTGSDGYEQTHDRDESRNYDWDLSHDENRGSNEHRERDGDSRGRRRQGRQSVRQASVLAPASVSASAPAAGRDSASQNWSLSRRYDYDMRTDRPGDKNGENAEVAANAPVYSSDDNSYDDDVQGRELLEQLRRRREARDRDERRLREDGYDRDDEKVCVYEMRPRRQEYAAWKSQH